MGLADKYAELIYRMAITRNKLKVIITPLGIIIWFSLSLLFIFTSLWLDELLPVYPLFSPPANLSLSVPLLVIGSTLALWTVCSFAKARGSPVPINPPKKLIITGLNSRTRNPMLLGWFIMLFGLGILFNSVSLIFIFLPLFILLNILYLKTVEEKEMEKKFGREYIEYKKSVPMFIPWFGKPK